MADVSLSLNEQETSLASDFTSNKVQDISSFIEVFKYF